MSEVSKREIGREREFVLTFSAMSQRDRSPMYFSGRVAR